MQRCIKVAGPACMVAGDVRVSRPDEMAGEGSRGGGVREAGERGEGRQVSASSPVTPIR